MIDPHSLSYPTTAIIQLFGLSDPDDLDLLYRVGHVIHKGCRRGRLPEIEVLEEMCRGSGRSLTMLLFLQKNHENAARFHGYWAIDKDPSE